MTTTEDDLSARLRPDVEHLLDLIDLLPFNAQDFWDRLAAAEHPDRDDDNYFVGHMPWIRERLRAMLAGADSLSAHNVERVAQYVLMFFDRDDPAMFEALDRFAGHSAAQPGRTGRRWVEDVCATAWRLYVPTRAVQRRDE